MNPAWIIEILTRFIKRICIPQYAQQGSWVFVHDSSCPHAFNIVKQFLPKKGVVQIVHPPFLPDLNPPDFFLFSRLKLALKGRRFRDISDIQRNVTMLLSTISEEDFLQSFQTCIADLSGA
ncbi:hypothetical protein TNCV_4874981 [Trichonephila clavipes]|nr:hypothetical protein TNCV_4874981 [Trichonephila clavipes]